MSPWKGSGPRAGRCTQLSPPSRLWYTPSTSIPAQTIRWSLGSTIMLVVRGMPIGQGRVTPNDSASQFLPPSCERKASGLVPTKIVSGSSASTVTDQIWMPSMGDSSFSHVLPVSSLRYSPTSVPARMRWGLSGYTAKARTLHSEGMGFLMRFHVIPPSGLHDRPPPTVPTQSLKSCAMAASPLQEKLPSYLSHGTIIGQICVHS